MIRADAPRADALASRDLEFIDGTHVATHHPPVDIADSEVVGVVDVAGDLLPFVIAVGLSGAGIFDVELGDGKSVSSDHGDMVGVAHRTHPVETRGVVGGGEFESVDIAAQDDMVAMGVFVDDNPGVVSGHRHVAKQGVGSLSPTISMVIQLGMGLETGGMMMRPR